MGTYLFPWFEKYGTLEYVIVFLQILIEIIGLIRVRYFVEIFF